MGGVPRLRRQLDLEALSQAPHRAAPAHAMHAQVVEDYAGPEPIDRPLGLDHPQQVSLDQGNGRDEAIDTDPGSTGIEPRGRRVKLLDPPVGLRHGPGVRPGLAPLVPKINQAQLQPGQGAAGGDQKGSGLIHLTTLAQPDLKAGATVIAGSGPWALACAD